MNTDQTQQVTISFNTDSEAEASALAAELQDVLQAENIPVERRRQDPNALDGGSLLFIEHLAITIPAAVIAHTLVEFVLRWKAVIVIKRPDGTTFTGKWMSLQHDVQALVEFLRSSDKPVAVPVVENVSEDY